MKRRLIKYKINIINLLYQGGEKFFMPVEYEFMKSAKDKEMSDEEYKTQRNEYDKKAEEVGNRIKKTMITFFVIFLISYVALYLFGLFNQTANYGNGVGNYLWLAVEFLMVILLYGIKAEDDKRHKYETDKKILLAYAKNKIQAYNIRLGLVIVFGILFLILNILCWWFAFTYLLNPAADTGTALYYIVRPT